MFKVYRDEILRLLAKASIGGGWDISFTDKVDIGESQARIEFHCQHRWVQFAFSKKNCKRLSISQVKECAKHEFGHFVTARLLMLASERHVTKEEIDEESEAIARIFEKIC